MDYLRSLDAIADSPGRTHKAILSAARKAKQS